MNNHVHILIESDKLAKFMHGVNLSYTQYFKYKYKITGHLWQDRYKSFVIMKDEYLISCISYIEFNPIRANLVISPAYYMWSSYQTRVLGKSNRLIDPIIL